MSQRRPEEALSRRSPDEWAERLSEDVHAIRERERQRLSEMGDVLENLRDSVGDSLSQRLTQLKSARETLPSPGQVQAPSSPPTAGGFSLTGLITDPDGTPMPRLRAQLVKDGTPLLGGATWQTNDFGRLDLSLEPEQIEEATGAKLRFLDTMEEELFVFDGLPSIEEDCAEEVEIQIPDLGTKAAPHLARHGRTQAETLGRLDSNLEEDIGTLTLERQVASMEIDRAIDETKAARDLLGGPG